MPYINPTSCYHTLHNQIQIALYTAFCKTRNRLRNGLIVSFYCTSFSVMMLHANLSEFQIPTYLCLLCVNQFKKWSCHLTLSLVCWLYVYMHYTCSRISSCRMFLPYLVKVPKLIHQYINPTSCCHTLNNQIQIALYTHTNFPEQHC